MLRRSSLFVCSVALAVSSSSTAFAVDDLDLFELDGNAVQDAAPAPPDDWATLRSGGGSSSVFTGVKADPSPQSIFGGGNKDIQVISSWGHKDGEVPDKDDITNAYAASYNHDGDLVVYFGADRVANAGDAFLGFWFFKQEITADPDGSFGGAHSPGDALVLVNFPQASNAAPEIAVVEWDPSCARAASNNPSPSQCAAQNLRLRLEGSGASGAVCGSVPGGDLACAIANQATEDSPWPYTSKDGFVNQFPFETFFEGGVNLSVLLGDACFASFMAETRSSSSFTASLKDFSLDSFPVCKIGITKQCTDGDVNASETGFVYTYSGNVTNEGFGTVYDVTVTDKGETFALGTISPQQSKPYGGTFASNLNPATNQASVTAASSPGGDPSLTDQTNVVECPAVDRDPTIGVTKDCSTSLMEVNDTVVVAVSFSGQVCNETGGSSGLDPIGLKNVTVSDDMGTVTSPAEGVIGDLAPNTCVPYSGSYLPSATDSTVPGGATFSDTVTASGVAKLGFGSASETASATCPLCPAQCDQP